MTAVEMILAAVRSEWTKLRRPTLLWGTYGALAVIAALLTVLIFAQAGHNFGRGLNLMTAVLASPAGLLYAFGESAGLLGVVALVRRRGSARQRVQLRDAAEPPRAPAAPHRRARGQVPGDPDLPCRRGPRRLRLRHRRRFRDGPRARDPDGGVDLVGGAARPRAGSRRRRTQHARLRHDRIRARDHHAFPGLVDRRRARVPPALRDHPLGGRERERALGSRARCSTPSPEAARRTRASSPPW